MTLPRQPHIGGWSPGRLQLSTFIRDSLAQVEATWGYSIYSAYRKAMKEEPTRKGKKKRRAISFASFSNYMYLLRRLGLIEYVLDDDGEIVTEDPERGNVPGELWVDDEDAGIKGGAKRQLIRIVPGKVGDPAWINPRKALYG